MLKLLKKNLKPLKHFMQAKLSREYKLCQAWLDLAPKMVCIDIGASYFPHGKWGLLRSSPHTTWVAVDPNAKNLGYIENWSWPSKVIPVKDALSQEGGYKTLYVTNTDSGSSLLKPIISKNMIHRTNEGYFFPIHEQFIKTSTLQDIFVRYSLKDPITIKLDTQGTELSILKGLNANILHDQVVCIELETTFLATPFYEGSHRFYEVQELIEKSGFELAIIDPIPLSLPRHQPAFRGRGVLNECDAVFIVRSDLAGRRSISFQLSLLGCYLSYSLYGEALNLIVKIQKNYNGSSEFTRTAKILEEMKILLS